VLARWRPPEVQRILPRESLGVAMAAGVRYVAMSPAIRTVLMRSVAFGIGASAPIALMPLIARHLLGGGPLTFGLLLGAFGAGAISGAMGAARLRQALSTEAVVRAACLAFAGAAALAGASERPVPTTLALFFCGAGWVLALATFNVAVQLSTPRWVVARALAMYQMAAFGGIAGGSWLWGAVAEQSSIMIALFAAAGVLLACAAIGAWRPLAQSAHIDLDPLRQWEAPETALPVDSRTGPVVITIEYRIREQDQLKFLTAMSERRRIRRRDGALNWRLLRDLSDPELWVERYETPTWLDYLRLNNRMTRDDAVIPASLRALHQGPESPRVRRMIERPTGSCRPPRLKRCAKDRTRHEIGRRAAGHLVRCGNGRGASGRSPDRSRRRGADARRHRPAGRRLPAGSRRQIPRPCLPDAIRQAIRGEGRRRAHEGGSAWLRGRPAGCARAPCVRRDLQSV
jgi:hypothetical protein